MSDGDLDRLQDSLEGSKGLRFKVAAVLLVLFGMIYGAIWGEAGTIIFSISSTVMLLFALVTPSEIAHSVLPRSLGRMSISLRRLFYSGDRGVRIMMIILAIGGTALVCKYGITGFSLLPKYADVVVKRMGAFLAIASPVIYAASLLSKRVYAMSYVELDGTTRRFELMFYVAVILFTSTLFVSFALFQIETAIVSNAKSDSLIFPKTETTVLPGLDLEQVKYIWWVCVVWLIWIVSLGLCLLSRFFERRWMWPIPKELDSNGKVSV